MLDPTDSLFLRYEITLYNLSEGQLNLLGHSALGSGLDNSGEVGYHVDTCTNPSVSALLPRIQNFGPTPGSMFSDLPALTRDQQTRLSQADAVQALGQKVQTFT